MKKWIRFSLILVGLAIIVSGCVSAGLNEQGEEVYKLHPNLVKVFDWSADNAEKIGEPVAVITSAINPVWGTAVGALAAMSGVFGTFWKTNRDKYVASQKKLDGVIIGVEAAYDGYQIVKKEAPELWEKIKPLFHASELKGGVNPDKIPIPPKT